MARLVFSAESFSNGKSEKSTSSFRRDLSRIVGTSFICLGFLGAALRDGM